MFLIVYLTSMPNGDAKNDETIVLYKADHSVIANSVPPLPSSILAEGLAVDSWIG